MTTITDPRVKGNRIAIGRIGFYDFDNPELSEFTLDDILVGLSRIYRFTGQSGITVLQHSINVYHAARQLGANREEQRQALFHDAHEAFVGDVVRPIWSRLRRFDTHDELNQMHIAAMQCIGNRFGFDWFPADVVKDADNHVLALEIRDEFDVDPATWGVSINPAARDRRGTHMNTLRWLGDVFKQIEKETRP